MSLKDEIEKNLELKFEYYEDVFENLRKKARDTVRPELDVLADSLKHELKSFKVNFYSLKSEGKELSEEMVADINNKWEDFENLANKKLEVLKQGIVNAMSR